MPCHERPDLAADSDQVLAMLVENLRRDDLTEVEEARGYQQLLDLGLSATKIAKATGTSRTRVRDALAVTKSDRALNTAAAHGLTLDQALVLTEFDGEDEALDALTETAVEPRRPAARRLPHPPGPRPPGPVRAARRRARSGRRHDPGHQRPENYGTKALSVPRGLDALTDGDGQDLDPEQHRSCPGHAVWIETYSWQAPRATYACLDPQAHGHRNRYGADADADPETKPPDEAKAERREVIETNKAWRAAEPVRRDHIRTLLNAGKVPKGTLRFVTAEIMADPAEIERGSDDMIAELTGHVADPTDTSLYQWGRTVGPAIEAKASDTRLPLVLLAQVAAAREQSIDVHTWRSTTARAEARWLRFLAGTGYTLSAIEQAVIDTAATAERDVDADYRYPAPSTRVAVTDSSPYLASRSAGSPFGPSRLLLPR